MALRGIKVLDMGRILAAPYATQILADQGAEVFKIEHPVRGDDTRSWGPPFTEQGAESAYFLSCNRNKKSIAVDLKSEDGRDLVLRLMERVDVVVENFPPGKADALGVGYEQARERGNAVYCSLTGYGSSGPYSDRLAYDVMVSSVGGLMGITGSPEAPAKVGVAITDVCAGLYASGAISAALFHRERTGQGQHLELSLLNTQVATLVNAGSNYLNAGQKGRRMGTAHSSIVPYEAFAARDGHVVVGALNDGQFVRLVQALGLPNLSSDPRFCTNPKRVENREELIKILNCELAKETVAHWVELLNENRVPSAPVNDLEQVFEDPQVQHSGIVHTMQHPTAGTIRVVGPPVSYSKTPCSVRSPPPTLGQHTAETLEKELKMTPEQINELASKRVISI